MGGALRKDNHKFIFVGGSLLVAATAVLYKMYFIDGGGITFMTSEGDDSVTGPGTTATENCTVLGMIPNASEDIAIPSDALLHPNAQAVIASNQESIRALKIVLQRAHTCVEQNIIRGHIDMLRNEIDACRSGVVPFRPPANWD